MDNNVKIALVAGDKRQLSAAAELALRGYEVAFFGFEKYSGNFGSLTKCASLDDVLSGACVTVLPLPYSNDGIHVFSPLSEEEILFSEVLSKAERGSLIMAGRVPPDAFTAAEKAGVRLHDYFVREELNVLNAIPTAEGAVAIALNELPITLHSSRVLVIGYGRVGKTLAHTLDALGAKVTVSARKCEDFAWIRVYGYECMNTDLLKGNLDTFDAVFNTVPFTVLDAEALKTVKPGTLIVDLASKPGGVDFNAAKAMNIKVVWALSLPGKAAPVTAGRIISESIINIMKSEGITP